MRANYINRSTGTGLFIAVGNYHSINENWYYRYVTLDYVMRYKGVENIIGIWKIKSLKNK
jgi:hypothetical protein